jgi:hypothetical protein
MALAIDDRWGASVPRPLCLNWNEHADLGLIFPNSNTIGDYDPEIGERFKYADAGPVNFEVGGFIRKRIWARVPREKSASNFSDGRRPCVESMPTTHIHCLSKVLFIRSVALSSTPHDEA